jgi:4-amino-4-deoxy-L-arabinose transferase-like glycosyltransferase
MGLMRAKAPPLVLAFCLLLFSARAFASLAQESATWDETPYFGLGRYLLENQRWDVKTSLLHPPLSFYLHSIPLLFADVDTDVTRGGRLLASAANADDRLLIASRLVMVAIGALLGGFVYAWSRALHGPWSAMLATVLYTFCPNILAHSRLITPDISLTAFSFASMYLLWRFLGSDRLRHAALGGVCLGLALLAKYTGALLVPVSLALMLLAWAKRRRIDLLGCGVYLGVAAMVLSLGYGTNLDPYFAGIELQREHARGGHSSFLMGEHSIHGWWYYFAVALALKTPIATLLLIAIGLWRLGGRVRKGGWYDEAFLLLPALVVFGFFSVNHQSIGLRYVLPIHPFLFVIAGEVARAASARARGLVAALVAWLVVASGSIHPHYLAYFNESIGGPAHGYEYLVDSNLDWGQDLKGLKRFMDEHSIPEIGLRYFGTDDPTRYGIRYRLLPGSRAEDPKARVPAPEPEPPPEWVAISATHLQGVYLDDPAQFASYARRRPFATIGHSIFVYHRDE